MKKVFVFSIATALLALAAQPAMAADAGAKIFKSKCTMCHALNKKKFGPAVKNMNADNAVLKETITNGRKSMPKFGKKLSAEQIDAVVEYLAAHRSK